MPPLKLESSIHVSCPQRWNLASPERGGAPKGRRGSSHLTVRTVPKNVRFALCFGTGAAKYIRSPNAMVVLTFALRDYLISPPLSGFARVGLCPTPYWGAAPNPAGALPPSPLGRCPKPRKPFFEEKGLDPKNLFSFYTVLCGFGHPH